jgi:hypothetical protein
VSRRPEKCHNCGFSSRYSKQQPGEVLTFCPNCTHWLCAGCREQMCVPHDHAIVDAVMITAAPAGVPVNDGIYSKISDNTYHGDPTSLSSSGARTLTEDCPAVFREKQDEPQDPKPQYDFGHAAHKMVLGEGQQLFVLDPAIHGRTKDGTISQNPKACGAWKAADTKAREAGKLPIAKADIDKAQRMAGLVHTNRLAAKLLSTGTPEVSGYWHDDETGVRLRFRPDWLTDPGPGGRILCVDYKSAVSAKPSEFKKAAAKYGYHQQAAWYLDGLREVEVSDDAAFVFVVQCKTAPFLVSIVQLDPEAIELGRRLNRRAINVFAECTANNIWPGYGDGIHTVNLPPWAITQQEAVLADV